MVNECKELLRRPRKRKRVVLDGQCLDLGFTMSLLQRVLDVAVELAQRGLQHVLPAEVRLLGEELREGSVFWRRRRPTNEEVARTFATERIEDLQLVVVMSVQNGMVSLYDIGRRKSTQQLETLGWAFDYFKSRGRVMDGGLIFAPCPLPYTLPRSQVFAISADFSSNVALLDRSFLGDGLAYWR